MQHDLRLTIGVAFGDSNAQIGWSQASTAVAGLGKSFPEKMASQ